MSRHMCSPDVYCVECGRQAGHIPLHHSLTREDVRWLRQHAELADVRTVQLNARGCPTLHWEERPPALIEVQW